MKEMKLKHKLITIMLSILLGALGTVIAQSYEQYWVAIGCAIVFGVGINEFHTFIKWTYDVGEKK